MIMELSREEKLRRFWDNDIHPITGWVDRPSKEMADFKRLQKIKKENRIKAFEKEAERLKNLRK